MWNEKGDETNFEETEETNGECEICDEGNEMPKKFAELFSMMNRYGGKGGKGGKGEKGGKNGNGGGTFNG